MSAPALRLEVPVDLLLDPPALRRGPLEVLWGQDAWIEHRAEPPRLPAVVRRRWWQRALGHRLFYAMIRIAPPEGTPLEPWAARVMVALDFPLKKPARPEDSGVWISAGTWARTAPGALGSVGRAFKRLDGFVLLGQVQIKVWAA